MTQTIVITSGKGGVGKTGLAANLSVQLASQGYSTCVFDADLGLANINILFGIYTEKTISDVVFHNIPLADIIVKNCHGIDIIPGSSGVEKIADLEPEQTETLIASFAELEKYDYLIFDTSAGVSRNVVSFCLSANMLTLVITSEPTSLTDGYALLKVLCLNGFSAPVKVVVNNCKNTSVAKNTYVKFRDVVRKYLSLEVQPLGFMVADPKVTDAVEKQKPFILLYPETAAAKCLRAIASNLVKQKAECFHTRSPDQFFKRFIDLFSGRLQFKSTDAVKQPPEKVKPAAPVPVPESVPPPAAELADQIKQPESLNNTVPEAYTGEDKQAAESPPGPDDTPEKKQPDEKTADAGLPDDNPYSFRNRQMLLNRLVESIQSVSDEIKLMREAVAANGNGLKKGVKRDHPPEQNEKKPVVLDFENYIPKKMSQPNQQK